MKIWRVWPQIALIEKKLKILKQILIVISQTIIIFVEMFQGKL